MDIRSARIVVSRELRDFGFWPTLYDLAFRAANRIFPCTIWKALTIDQVNASYSKLPDNLEARLLDAEEMRAYARPENDLDEEIVDQACENGDRCMAVFDRGKLASYGWYSNQPTDINEELRLRFRDDYVYMYKGFTRDEYRGQRLHAIGMTLAVTEYLALGYRGIVSLVASNNFSSLKSCYRMGYRDVGKIYGVKIMGRYRLHHGKGCDEYGLTMGPRQSSRERASTLIKVA